MEERIPSFVEELMEEKEVKFQESHDNNQIFVKQKLFEIPDCPICLTELSSNLYAQRCGHVFHQECTNENLMYSGSCPICKMVLSTGTKLFLPLVQRQIFTNESKNNVSQSTSSKISILELNYNNLKQANKNLKLEIQQVKEKYLMKCLQATQEQNYLKNKIEIKDQIISQLNIMKVDLLANVNELNLIINDKDKIIKQKQIEIKNLLQLGQKNKNQIQDQKKAKKQLIQEGLSFIKSLQQILKKHSKTFKLKIQIQQNTYRRNYLKDISSLRQSYRDFITSQISQFIEFKMKQILDTNTLNQQLNEKIRIQQEQINSMKSKIKDLMQQKRMKNVEYSLKDKEYQLRDQKSKIKDQKYKHLYQLYHQNMIHCQYYRNQFIRITSKTSLIPMKLESQQNKQNDQNRQNQQNQQKQVISTESINKPQDNLVPDESDLEEFVSCQPY